VVTVISLSIRLSDLMKLCWLFTCLTITCFAQKATINGYVKDAATGENLIGAAVMHPATMSGTTANVHGFYSITLKADSCTLVYSYVGYQPQRLSFRLTKDTAININLISAGQLDEVVIEATRGEELQELTKMGSITISSDQIKSLPAFLGEVDVLKVLQLMPGVKSSEGSTGLYVRGGGPDQNLMLLDGVPVYNASHLFGFFSVFNADAINRVELIKGGFPARYGGRLSSVIDINMKDGNMREFHGEGSVGLVAAKITLEGPVIKNKTSVLVSARRTYLDVLARPIMQLSIPEDVTLGYYFTDFNVKLNHIINQRNRVYLSSYFGKDKAYSTFRESYVGADGDRQTEARAGLDWGNFITALRWNHVSGPRLFSNFTATYSQYRFNVFSEYEDWSKSGGSREYYRARYMSGIRDWAAKLDLEFVPTPDHYIRFGAQAISHLFSPGVAFSSSNIDGDTTLGATNVYAGEFAAYVEDDFRIGRALKLNVGMHASAFAVESKWYYSVQPRVSTRLLFGRSFSLKASYATMTQYIHLLTNAGLGLPTDLWVPSTSRVSPQQANQLSLGISKSHKSMYEFSIESYYKKMSNLIEYRDGASFVDIEDNWQDNVATGGIGESYGAEVLVQKEAGKMTGWIGYTLSWTNRQFDELNFGRWYPYKYDRRHDVSIALSHNWNDRIDFSVVWVYGTGNAITLPVATYSGIEEGPPGTHILNPRMMYYGDRNDFRMRSYHRLDISVGFTKKKKWGEREWVIGAYNAYNRMNPFYMDLIGRDGRIYFAQYALFPIIPSIAYNFKF
jgi:hypothetical protein